MNIVIFVAIYCKTSCPNRYIVYEMAKVAVVLVLDIENTNVD